MLSCFCSYFLSLSLLGGQQLANGLPETRPTRVDLEKGCAGKPSLTVAHLCVDVLT